MNWKRGMLTVSSETEKLEIDEKFKSRFVVALVYDVITVD